MLPPTHGPERSRAPIPRAARGGGLKTPAGGADSGVVTGLARLLRSTVLAVLAVGTVQLAVPTSAAAHGASRGEPVSPTPTSATEAQALADASARRVAELTRRYRQAGAEVATTAAALARAFADQAGADQAGVRAQEQLEAARAEQATQVRALYADGGQLGLTMTVLTSQSADDVLWWAGVTRYVEDSVGTAASRTVDRASAAATRAAAAADTTTRRSLHLVTLMRQLRDRAAEEESLLVQARVELDRLRQRAGDLAAEEEARRLAAAEAAARRARLATTEVGALPVPEVYLATYRRAAATCTGLDWTLLAAVGQIESGHGRNNGPSSAGAIGPMQFMPATFAAYAVDGDGDGLRDPWDYQDAIFTAARYLCASGADEGTPDGVHRALLAYNRAEWYVDLVLGAQATLAAALSS